jgi:zinc transport system substrate-binding protein
MISGERIDAMRAWPAIICLLTGLGLVSGGPVPGAAAGSAPLSCQVSILPIAFFVDRIGGDRVETAVLIGPGQSPESFEPTSKQLVRLSQSRLFFATGTPFESQILSRIRSNFKTVEIIDLKAGITLQQLAGEPDPHFWLNPVLMKTLAANVRDALVRADSSNHSLYMDNCAALIAALDKTDREIREILAPYQGSEIIVYHPSYGYFTSAYGLRQLSIESEGADPGPKHLAELIEYAKSNKIKTVFTQPQFSASSARAIADEIGAGLVVLDPLARDYLNNLIEMALAISKSFQKE